MPRIHREIHRTDRVGWLRAAVLGANDGIVSTASLVLGVAAHMGGAPVVAGAWRVTFWGALAMAVTAGIGALFGTAIG
jgi:VIT1/CCC1 family predicted Fe2+/Mn2+ transporter